MRIVQWQYVYLCILVFSLAGLVLADWKFKLVFFYDAAAAAKTIGILMALFLVVDIIGIRLGIFFTNQKFVSGWHIVSKNLPVEELLFLFLLGYVTLVGYSIIAKWMGSLDKARDDEV